MTGKRILLSAFFSGFGTNLKSVVYFSSDTVYLVGNEVCHLCTLKEICRRRIQITTTFQSMEIDPLLYGADNFT